MATTRPTRTTASPHPNNPRAGSSFDLRALAIQVFQAIGALVDEGADGELDVLIPEEYQDQLSGENFLRLVSDPAVAARTSAALLAIGSPIVDQLVALAERFGRSTRWYVEGLKWSHRQAINLDRWGATFVNARLRGDGVEHAFAAHYLLLNYRVSYVSDEKREELHTVVLDTRTRQASDLLGRFWQRRPAPEHDRLPIPEALRPAGVTWPEPIVLTPRPSAHFVEDDRLPNRAALEELRERALTLLERQIAGSLAGYRRRAENLLELERARIDAFFDDTEAELRRREARTEDPARREAIQSKLEAARLDRERKYADLAAKHKLRVVVKLLNAAIITQPKVRTMLTAENRYATVHFAVVYDPLTGEVELPTCEGCSEPTRVVHLTANGRLLCDRCAVTCGFCKREYAETGDELARCAVCQRPICLQHQVTCAECGARTCPEDRGRCHAASPTASARSGAKGAPRA